MKYVIISLFVCLAVLVTSCSKSVTTTSSKPERFEPPASTPQNMQVSSLDAETPPPDFVEFEKAPQIIKGVAPRYPESAREAGLEGKVWVKIWVDKTGKPRQSIVQKSSSTVFDQAAIEAAKQMVFSPAILKGAPTDVWVMIPFDFKLR